MTRTLIRFGQAGLALALLASAGCAAMTPHPKQVVLSQQCSDIDFPIYFERKSAALTKPALHVVADAGRGAKGCVVASVSVVGLSGGPNVADRSLDISSRRASAVAKALTDAGLPAPKFDVSAVANGQDATDASREPLQRRAEVIIKFAH